MSDQIQRPVNRQGIVRDSLERRLADLGDYLDERLKRHDGEMGAKMGASLRIFFEQAVLPVINRVEELERPWYKRLWRRVAAKFSRRPETTPAMPGPSPSPSPSATEAAP